MSPTSINPTEKYCTDCGKVILRRAEICPGCGCRQMAAPSSFGVPSMPSNAGKVVALIIGNILWNGLGNLIIGDSRGWKWGSLNWLLFIPSLFTLGIPCVIGCIYFSMQGYEFLKAQSQTA
jgi:hypothetical protein